MHHPNTATIQSIIWSNGTNISNYNTIVIRIHHCTQMIQTSSQSSDNSGMNTITSHKTTITSNTWPDTCNNLKWPVIAHLDSYSSCSSISNRGTVCDIITGYNLNRKMTTAIFICSQAFLPRITEFYLAKKMSIQKNKSYTTNIETIHT